jgi:hypothetical protein
MKRALAFSCVVCFFFCWGAARAEGIESTGFPAIANGDVNGDWARDVSDVTYLFGFLYLGGEPPAPLLRVTDLPGIRNGDANGDGALDLGDPIHILKWLFLGGDDPVSVLSRAPIAGGGAYESPIAGTYVFPDVPLHEVEPWLITPEGVDLDHGIDLGGVGSDLWYDRRGGGSGGYWLVTDLGAAGRGPRPDRFRTLVVPEYSPVILKVAPVDGILSIEEVLPLVGRTGKRLTGLSNNTKYDYTRYSWDATVQLPFDPDSIDPEGLVRTSAGDFWICEEFAPSIVRIDPTGKVLKRFVPAGWGPKVDASTMDYELSRTLPGIFTLRQKNNGFEGIAMDREETTLYVALQCPLDNPKDAGPASRNTRILVFDIATESVVAEYVYRFDDVNAFDPENADGAQDEMKLSSLVALNKNMLLVGERTDWVARVFMVNIAKATNILGTAWDDPATSPSIETLDDPASAGVTVLPKKLFVDLNLPGMPGKIEGKAMLDEEILGVINDNDFGLDGDGKFDAEGNNIDSGIQSELILIDLTAIHVKDDGKGQGNMPHDEDE